MGAGRTRDKSKDGTGEIPPKRSAIKRAKGLFFKTISLLSSQWIQIFLYMVTIILFQALSREMRQPSEYMFYKYITDLLLEAPFTDGGNLDDVFMGIGEVADIHMWADEVMWPALLKDTYPREPTGEGDSLTYYTPTELAEGMDIFDWTDGVSLRWNRAKAAPISKCKPQIDKHHSYLLHNLQKYGHATDTDQGEQAPIRANHNLCYPDIYSLDMGAVQGEQETASYGHNSEDPNGELSHPFIHRTSEELNSNPGGQPSASVLIGWGHVPTDGYAAFVIPFFSDEFLEEQTGVWSGVTDFRLFSRNAGESPKYFCVRLAWSTDWLRQLCDPNDSLGRTTGVVPNAIRELWADIQRARWIDSYTRMVTITLPLRNNHAAVRFRLSLMMQISSLGAVVPSYDVESRFDAADQDSIDAILTTALLLVIYFMLVECNEVREEGCIDYFANMWNLMDWANFGMFFALYIEYHHLEFAREDFRCELICKQVGFHDPWMVMLATTNCKQLLAILTTIQWLKVIKYVNSVVPKFALATSVLSHGLADLLMFFLFFVWSIIAFAQLFYIQLGPYMEGYTSLTLSSVTLARALFGDFDIEAVLNTSNSWINVGFFLAYLFVAVFILLSIFLTILGEHQGYVREDDPSLNSWGVVGKVHDYIERKRDIVLDKFGQGGSKKKGTRQSTISDMSLLVDAADADALTEPATVDTPLDTPLAVTQLASLGKTDADEAGRGAFNGEQRREGGMWAMKTSLEKLDEKMYELSAGIAQLQESGDDPEKLSQLEEDIAVVRQLQTARLIQKKADELRTANIARDTPEQEITDAPRRHGLFGTMPRQVDTRTLAHDVAKIKAMLSKQESMLNRLLRDRGLDRNNSVGDPHEGDIMSGGAIATMRLHGRSRQGSGIRSRTSQGHSTRNGPSGNSARSACSVRTDPGPPEAGADTRPVPLVLRRTSPDIERTPRTSDGMGSSGPAEEKQRRRERRHSTPPTSEEASPSERRSGASRSASAFFTGV